MDIFVPYITTTILHARLSYTCSLIAAQPIIAEKSSHRRENVKDEVNYPRGLCPVGQVLGVGLP
jgi:hypothetical protein